MDQHRIGLADIALGQPLQWDVRDATGHLLLKRGQVIQTAQQIEALIARGLFIQRVTASANAHPTAAVVPEIRSVLHMINSAGKQLERVLFNLQNETDATQRLLAVAGEITTATHANHDIAIASILLNQDAGGYPVRHCIDSAIVSVLVAERLRLPADQVSLIAAAALSMNVGMLREQAHFHTKAGPLNDNERLVVRSHPEKSVALLQHAGVTDQIWLDAVLQHHESQDGSGYPAGKSGGDISQGAKIISLADRYCARVSARTYRAPMLPNAALRDFLVADKKNIDQGLAALFVHVLGIYPCGTFVRLADGETGVVTSKGESTTTPFVHAILGPRGAPLAFPIKRDTAKPLHAIREVLASAAVSMPVSMHKIWGKEAAL